MMQLKEKATSPEVSLIYPISYKLDIINRLSLSGNAWDRPGMIPTKHSKYKKIINPMIKFNPS